MKLLVSVFMTLIFTYGYSQNNNTKCNLMPLPSSIEYHEGYFPIEKSFSIVVEGYKSDRLLKYADKVLRRISNESGIFVDQGVLSQSTNPKQSSVILDVERKGNFDFKFGW